MGLESTSARSWSPACPAVEPRTGRSWPSPVTRLIHMSSPRFSRSLILRPVGRGAGHHQIAAQPAGLVAKPHARVHGSAPWSAWNIPSLQVTADTRPPYTTAEKAPPADWPRGQSQPGAGAGHTGGSGTTPEPGVSGPRRSAIVSERPPRSLRLALARRSPLPWFDLDRVMTRTGG